VLHDFRLHHFFDGIFRVKRRDLHSYLAVMEKYYGENGRREALICYQRQAVNIDVMAERFPLTEFALEQAVGIVVHTSEAFESLKQERDCPVAYLPLPFPLTSIKPRERVSFSAGLRRRLIVFGYIGRNRRLNSILQALAELDEKDQFRLDVFGSILNDEKELRHRVNTLGLKNLVTLHGFTPEAELDKALAGCDLAINLRFPTMGEASGSQLRIWAHGCPSLVSRVGWYSTLPEDSVAFVRTGEHEVSDIKNHLRELLKDPERFAKMGMVGRQVLEGEHSVESYVEGIVKLAEQASQQRARLATLQLAERASRIIHGWIEPEQGTESVRSAAAEVFALTERP
jgi:glycosyltransferase involved in cell wall biosynthesis